MPISDLLSASNMPGSLGSFLFLWIKMMRLAEAISEGSEILGFSPLPHCGGLDPLSPGPRFMLWWITAYLHGLWLFFCCF